jgi:hypothetical protein
LRQDLTVAPGLTANLGILLPQPPECWDHRRVLPRSAPLTLLLRIHGRSVPQLYWSLRGSLLPKTLTFN